ncbi:MAG: PAS domain S-box protein [Bacteroidia bacterium]|nr:PAS domain S-box protein [Bacteroidia bacterium]
MELQKVNTNSPYHSVHDDFNTHFLAFMGSFESGLLMEDENRRVVFTNPAFYKLFGIPPENRLEGKDCGELLLNAVHFFENPELAKNFIERVIAEKKSDWVYPLFSHTGMVLRLNYHPVWQNGEFKGHIWQYQDKTEDYRNESELDRSTRALSDLQLNSFEGIIHYNLQSKSISFISGNFHEISGYGKNDFPDGFETYKEKIAPDDKEWYLLRFAQDLAGKIPGRILKYRFKTGSGKIIWLRESGKFIYDKDGIATEYLLSITDISNLVLAETKARENFEKFRLIADNSKDLVCLVDLMGTCEFASGNISSFGYSGLDVVGRKFIHFIYPEDRFIIEDLFKEIKQDEMVESVEFRFLKESGTPVWVEANLSLFQDSESRPSGIILNIRDVTERRKRIEELQFKNSLVQAISEAQLNYITTQQVNESLGILMQRLVSMSGSEFGFVGEIQELEPGKKTLLTHFLTDVSWNRNIGELYREKLRHGLKFTNMNSLFGLVINTGEVVIRNNPTSDARKLDQAAIPVILGSFMGIPLKSGDELIGMIALGNRIGGYDQSLLEKFNPIYTVCSSILQSHLNQNMLNKTRQELEASEGQIRALLSSMEDLVLELGEEDKVFHFWRNDESADFFRHLDFKGKKLENLPFPFSSERLIELVKEVSKSGQSKYIELPITKESKETWFQFKVSRTLHQSISILVQNISDRKQIEREVEKLKDFYEFLLNNLPIDVVVFSKDHKYVYVNTKAINDKEKREWLIGKDDFDYAAKYGMPLKYAEERRLHFLKAIETREIVEFEEEFPGKGSDGNGVWVLRFFTPMVNELGEVDRVLGFGLEITERKTAELDILKNLDRQKQLNELKNKFVSTISHEFRTPLATIRSSMDLMDLIINRKPVQTQKIQDFIGVVNNEIAILTNLLNDVLMLGRHESRQTPFHPKLNNLHTTLREVIHKNFSFNNKRQIEVNLFSEIADTVFDEKLIGHILNNLLSNALKYSEKNIRVTLDQNSQGTRISVIDQGIGIPEKDMESLFNSFFRASNSKDIQGTGLGLVIVKNFLDLHKGTIELKSKLGKGSVFTIFLPSNLEPEKV